MFKNLILIILVSTSILSCKKDEITVEYVESEIFFHHSVDGNPIQFNQFIYTNEFGNNYTIQTLRYFISNITLKALDGDVINFDTIIYVDANDSEYLKAVFNKKIPNKNYSQIKFTFGIPSAQNITGYFNNFPEAAMEWPVPMGGGYHYMKFEGKFDSSNDTLNFNVHTGPFDNNPNYFDVVLPLDLEVENNSFQIGLNMEINNWFKNPNTINLENVVGGIMGNQVMQQKFKENGDDVFSVSY